MLLEGKEEAHCMETLQTAHGEALVNVNDGAPSPIQGQLLRLSERREVAIFLRDGALWVADFIDGKGELIDAVTWFQFHCASLSTAQARHRMVLESGIPLSDELVGRIELLPRR